VAVAIFPEVREGHIVAAAEAFTVLVAVRWGDRWAAEVPFPVYVRILMVFEVAAAGFDAIVEALALHIAELLRRRIPSPAIMFGVILTIALLWLVRTGLILGRAVPGHGHGATPHPFPEVRKGHIVAAAEAVAILVASLRWNGWLAEFRCHVHVRAAVVFDVSAGGLNAVVKTMTLHIAELRRRRVPAAVIIVPVVLPVTLLWLVRGRAVLG